MEAKIVYVTPAIAKSLLGKNVKNRGISTHKVDEYAQAMELGHWKENGESIILDENNVLKDGQHRLRAILKANKAYNMVLVTGVGSEVMQTIDIGKNRSLKDLLDLHNVRNSGAVAAIIVRIYNHINDIKVERGGTKSGRQKMSNTMGLEYYFKHSSELEALTKIAQKTYARQITKIWSVSDIGLFHYLISGFYEDPSANEFLNNICGVIIKENTAATWVYKQAYNAKNNKIRLHKRWLLAMVIKAFNSFLEGDSPVKYMTYDLNTEMPKVLK